MCFEKGMFRVRTKRSCILKSVFFSQTLPGAGNQSDFAVGEKSPSIASQLSNVQCQERSQPVSSYEESMAQFSLNSLHSYSEAAEQQSLSRSGGRRDPSRIDSRDRSRDRSKSGGQRNPSCSDSRERRRDRSRSGGQRNPSRSDSQDRSRDRSMSIGQWNPGCSDSRERRRDRSRSGGRRDPSRSDSLDRRRDLSRSGGRQDSSRSCTPEKSTATPGGFVIQIIIIFIVISFL